jgi:hypothetical protein
VCSTVLLFVDKESLQSVGGQMCRAINVAAASSQSAKSNASGKHRAEQLVHRQTEITAMFSKETSARLDARTNQTIGKVK